MIERNSVDTFYKLKDNTFTRERTHMKTMVNYILPTEKKNVLNFHCKTIVEKAKGFRLIAIAPAAALLFIYSNNSHEIHCN